MAEEGIQLAARHEVNGVMGCHGCHGWVRSGSSHSHAGHYWNGLDHGGDQRQFLLNLLSDLF